MNEMVEKVARAICHAHGARISGPGQSHASRECGWEMDGGHNDKYVERHWREFINHATFAVSVMREPTDAMLDAVIAEHTGATIHTELAARDFIKAATATMIDAALTPDEPPK